MSLLHEALKKAEREKGQGAGGDPFVDTVAPPRTSHLRVTILAGLVGVSLISLILLRVFHQQRPVVEDPSQASLASVGQGSLLARDADLYLAQGRWSNAEKALQKWVLEEPRNAEAYNNLGLALKKLGRTTEAYEQYKKALMIRPEYPEAENNLGALYLTLGKIEEAGEQFQKALQLRPEYAEPYFHLAMIFEAQGKRERARENYEIFLKKARALDPRGLDPRGLDPKLIQEVRGRIEALLLSGS